MIIYLLATLVSIAVAASLCVALYGWFKLSLQRFDRVVAQDVLTQWDAQMAELSEYDREQERAQPPVAVLEAILALPSRQPWRLQVS